MDPSKLKPGEDLAANALHLQSQAQNVLDRILTSIDNVPRYPCVSSTLCYISNIPYCFF